MGNKRKRRHSEMEMEDNKNNEIKSRRRKRRRKSCANKENKMNYIITPGTKTKPNRKIISSSTCRTVGRSTKGRSAIGSGKRPLRLVLGDKTNQTKKKKRKLNT